MGEQKTKPTQHSVQQLRSLGLTPHMLACRTQGKLEDGVKKKLSLFCHVPDSHIINLHDVSNIWHVPLIMQEQGCLESVLKCLKMPLVPPDLNAWSNRAHRRAPAASHRTVRRRRATAPRDAAAAAPRRAGGTR